MTNITVTEIRLNTSTMQFYAKVDSRFSYQWLEIDHNAAQWMLGQCKPLTASGKPGIGDKDAHNIYWTLEG